MNRNVSLWITYICLSANDIHTTILCLHHFHNVHSCWTFALDFLYIALMLLSRIIRLVKWSAFITHALTLYCCSTAEVGSLFHCGTTSIVVTVTTSPCRANICNTGTILRTSVNMTVLRLTGTAEKWHISTRQARGEPHKTLTFFNVVPKETVDMKNYSSWSLIWL